MNHTAQLTEKQSLGDWLVVLASAMGLAAAAVHLNSTGIFMGYLEKEFTWSRGQISAGLMIVSVATVLLAPFAGSLIDRVGSRRVALGGMALYSVAVALLSVTTFSIWIWWVLWSFLALPAVLVKPTVWLTAVNGRFTGRRRGLAIGLALSGASVGGAAIPPLTYYLIEVGGWRFAYLSLGAIIAAVSLPAIVAFLKDRPNLTSEKRSEAFTGLSVKEGLKSSQFLRLAIISFFMTAGVTSLVVHFVPIMSGYSVPRSEAVTIAGLIGLTAIVGRIGTGWLLGYVAAPTVGTVVFVLPIIMCFLLIGYGGAGANGIIVAVLIGFSMGAEIDIIGYLAASYFGMKNYGTLFGTLAGLISFGAGFGPFISGVLYDVTGDYQLWIWCLIPTFMVCSALSASLIPSPYFRYTADVRS